MYLTIEGLPELTDKRQQKIAQALVITLAQHDVLVTSPIRFENVIVSPELGDF